MEAISILLVILLHFLFCINFCLGNRKDKSLGLLADRMLQNYPYALTLGKYRCKTFPLPSPLPEKETHKGKMKNTKVQNPKDVKM